MCELETTALQNFLSQNKLHSDLFGMQGTDWLDVSRKINSIYPTVSEIAVE